MSKASAMVAAVQVDNVSGQPGGFDDDGATTAVLVAIVVAIVVVVAVPVAVVDDDMARPTSYVTAVLRYATSLFRR